MKSYMGLDDRIMFQTNTYPSEMLESSDLIFVEERSEFRVFKGVLHHLNQNKDWKLNEFLWENLKRGKLISPTNNKDWNLN